MKARGGGRAVQRKCGPAAGREGVDARRRAGSSGWLPVLRRERDSSRPRWAVWSSCSPARPESGRGFGPWAAPREAIWRAAAVALEALPESGARPGRAGSGAGGPAACAPLRASSDRMARAAEDERRDRVGPEQRAGGGEKLLPPLALFSGF